jgi:glycerol-3-phosphate O-acyltransferase/dihydroxyacetone phosphate acyltransferase
MYACSTLTVTVIVILSILGDDRQVEDGMRSVLVTANDWTELKTLHTVRRLYQRSSVGLDTRVRQDLSRRFSTALRLLTEKYGGQLPEDAQTLREKVETYQATLDKWGLKDYQVASDLTAPYSRVLLTFLTAWTAFLLSFLPSLFLNAPVGLAARVWAEEGAKKDLARSRVKVQARDVVLSKKISFCIVAVPTLWISYAVLLLLLSPLQPRTVLALFLAMPVFSYFGVTTAEAGMIQLKDLRPAGLRLLPGFKYVCVYLYAFMLFIYATIYMVCIFLYMYVVTVHVCSYSTCM